MISSVLDLPKPSGSSTNASPSRQAKDDWKWDDTADDTEDEVLFDQNSLLDRNGAEGSLNLRRSAPLNRAAVVTPKEALRWKLLCLCSAFVVMGMSTSIIGPTLPDIGSNTYRYNMTEFAQIFLANGFGFLVGSVTLCILFTRLNAFLFLLALLLASVPCTTLIIWMTSFNSVMMLSFGQGLVFGAIERGGFLMVHGLWKGNKRVFFALYFCLSLGASLSSVLSTSVVFDRVQSYGVGSTDIGAPILHQEHKIVKRAEPSDPHAIVDRQGPVVPLVGLTDGQEGNETAESVQPPKATRPSSAVGIIDNQNSKTVENEQKRKEAETKKKQEELEKANKEKNITAGSSSVAPVTEKDPPTTVPSTTPSTTSTTTTPTTTTSSTTTTTTTPAPILPPKDPNNVKFMPDEGITSPHPTLPSRARNRQQLPEVQGPGGTMQSFVDQVKTGVSQVKEKVQSGVSQMAKNTDSPARAAYMIIMVLSFVLMAPYVIGFCCCCIKWSAIADSRIVTIRLDSSQYITESLKCRVFSILVLILASSADAILLAFLPKFITDYYKSNPEASKQNNSALLMLAFWLAAGTARGVFILRPSLSISSRVIHVLYLASVIACYAFHHFMSMSDNVLFLGISSLALFSANIPQSIITWHHSLLEPPSYRLSRRYLASLSIGRMLGPILCAWICEKSGTMVIFKIILVLHIIGYVLFIFLSRFLNAEARQRQIQQLGGEVSGKTKDLSRNGHVQKRKGPYRALLEEDDDDVDLEMDYIRRPSNSLSDSADEM